MSETVTLDEVWRLFKETDRQFKETDRQFKETDRQLRETDRKIALLADKINKLTGKWGHFIEGMVVPAAKRIFSDRGIPVHKTAQRVYSDIGEGMEVDVLVHNSEHIIAIEVKSSLSVDDVREHVERLKNFKTCFPEYEKHSVIGAVAGIVIDRGVDKYAYRNGLFVLTQSGDTVVIANDDKFVPKAW